jgi:hypothetical protein
MRIVVLVSLLSACATSHPCDEGAALPPCTDCQQGGVRIGRFSCGGGESVMTPDGQLAHVVGQDISVLNDTLSPVRNVVAGNYVLAAAFDADGTVAVLSAPATSDPPFVTLIDASGAKSWSMTAGTGALGVSGTIAIGPSRVFVTTSVPTLDAQGISSSASTLSAFDRATGALAWSRADLATARVVADPGGGAIVAANTSSTAGFVMAIDDAGQAKWTTAISADWLAVSVLARDPGGAIGFALAWSGANANLGTVALTSRSVGTRVAFGMIDAGGAVLWARNDIDDTYAGAINSVVVVGDQLAIGSGNANSDGVLELASATTSTLLATASGAGLHDIVAVGTPDPTSLLVSIGSTTNADDYDHNAYNSEPPDPTLVFDGVVIHGDGVALARLAL